MPVLTSALATALVDHFVGRSKEMSWQKRLTLITGIFILCMIVVYTIPSTSSKSAQRTDARPATIPSPEDTFWLTYVGDERRPKAAGRWALILAETGKPAPSDLTGAIVEVLELKKYQVSSVFRPEIFAPTGFNQLNNASAPLLERLEAVCDGVIVGEVNNRVTGPDTNGIFTSDFSIDLKLLSTRSASLIDSSHLSSRGGGFTVEASRIQARERIVVVLKKRLMERLPWKASVMRTIRLVVSSAWILMVLVWPLNAQKALPDATSELAGKIDKQMQREQKRKVAVVPFRELGGQATVFGTYLAEALVTNLVDLGKLELVERSTLDRVMGELKLDASGAIDPATAQRVGKLVGADAIVTGTVTDFLSFVSVNCRLIETQTGRIFAAAESKIVKDDDVRKVMNVPLSGGSSGPSVSRPPAPISATAFSGETKRAGPLEVHFLGCRPKALGLYCSAMVTNRQDEHQYCLYGADGDVMSRLVDDQGHVYKANEVDFAEKHTENMVITCTALVGGIPVHAGLFYANGPQNGQLALVEFRFDLDRSYAGRTSFKAEFRGVPVVH